MFKGVAYVTVNLSAYLLIYLNNDSVVRDELINYYSFAKIGKKSDKINFIGSVTLSKRKLKLYA